MNHIGRGTTSWPSPVPFQRNVMDVDARESRAPVPVLVIRGPSGVGKTTVAHEISSLLRRRRIGHAFIDTDELVRIFPPPPTDPQLARLAALNLAHLWSNYWAAGARRLILTAVIESVDTHFAWVRESIPEAKFSLVRLRATEDALYERLFQRCSTDGFNKHLRSSVAVGREMDREPADACMVVETTGRESGQVARDILKRTGWM